MMEKISTRQEILIITVSRLSTVITIMTIIHTGTANQDIWIALILSAFYTIITNIPLIFLSTKFSDLTLIGYMEKIFGKIIGKIIGILYGVLFIRIVVFFFYIAIQMIRMAFMTELSPVVIIFVIMIVCIYAASSGLEVLARTVEVFGPIIIGSIIIFVLLGYNNIDFSILLPVYKDSTFLGVNRGALQISLVFTDLYILSMNMPQLENKKDIYIISIRSTIYSLVIILMMLVVTQTSLGIEQAKHSNYPFLTYVRMVRTYSIFERIESAFLVTWTVTIMTKISAYIYISGYAFKEIFKKKNANIFIYSISIISAAITYYLADINSMIVEIITPKLPEYIYYFIFKTVIPIIAVIVYFFRRKSLNKQQRLSN